MQGQQGSWELACSFPSNNWNRLNTALPAISEEASTVHSEDRSLRRFPHLVSTTDARFVAVTDNSDASGMHLMSVPASAREGINSQLVAQRAFVTSLDVEHILIAAIDKRLNELFLMQQRLQAASAAAAASTFAPAQHTAVNFPNQPWSQPTQAMQNTPAVLSIPTAPIISRVMDQQQ